ncbi:hypothetical protein FHR81_003924 [Actinoalloteichus hoggarensis]|uniref:hypothetical protein n=1 Tax=Actinoalloteichus hoggarensis TaxID=1470176 RepID=UPI000B8A71CF|nr:hypothetical protein [Actinoalloteichus hoggarensis]MBB5922867.1 hypothetical protein [Actinoalloteichus hoggarensis]
MTWQEEAQKLDADLATGRISAEEYRARRDQLQAGGQGTTGTPQSTGHEAPSSMESTQLIGPNSENDQRQGGATPPSDATQVVRQDWRQQPGGQAGGQSDADRTQVVRGLGQQQPQGYPQQGYPAGPPPQAPQSPPGGFPQGNYNAPPPGMAQPPWAGGDSQPPWAGSDLPPMAAGSSENWIRQGPEAFESDGGGKGPKIVAVVVAVVVLAAIAFGAWMLWGQGESTEASDDTSQTGAADPSDSSPSSEEAREPRDPLLPADIGGAQELDKAEIVDYPGIQEIRTLTEGEDAAFTTGGAADARALVSNFDDGTHVVVFVVQMADEESATTARDELTTLQENYGLELRDGPPGVNEAWLVAGEGDESMVRAHYVSEDLLIRIQVRGTSEQAVGDRHQEVLNQQMVSQVPNE